MSDEGYHVNKCFFTAQQLIIVENDKLIVVDIDSGLALTFRFDAKAMELVARLESGIEDTELVKSVADFIVANTSIDEGWIY